MNELTTVDLPDERMSESYTRHWITYTFDGEYYSYQSDEHKLILMTDSWDRVTRLFADWDKTLAHTDKWFPDIPVYLSENGPDRSGLIDLSPMLLVDFVKKKIASFSNNNQATDA